MKQQKKQYPIERAMEDWLGQIVPVIAQEYGIGNVAFYYSFSSREGTVKKGEGSRSAVGSVVFQIGYDAPYRSAYITVYPKALELFKEKKWGALMNGVTHEVAHIITGPMVDLAFERHSTEREMHEENESLTEAVAQLGRKVLLASRPKLFEALSKKVKTLR